MIMMKRPTKVQNRKYKKVGVCNCREAKALQKLTKYIFKRCPLLSIAHIQRCVTVKRNFSEFRM